MSSGGWAKCSEEGCEKTIDSKTPEKETRCEECRFPMKKKRCSSKGCHRKTKPKICNYCKHMSDTQCENSFCDSFLTKDEVSHGVSICIECNGEARCHPYCDK